MSMTLNVDPMFSVVCTKQKHFKIKNLSVLKKTVHFAKSSSIKLILG